VRRNRSSATIADVASHAGGTPFFTHPSAVELVVRRTTAPPR